MMPSAPRHVLFIPHADHEQNCSANEAVLIMLSQIGNISRLPDFIKKVKGAAKAN